jgi:ubiquitin C-terminal hydrolase
MFTAFVHAFAQADRVRRTCAELGALGGDELADTFALYVTGCAQFPTAIITPRQLFGEFVSQKPDPAEWRAITLTALVRRFLKALGENFVDVLGGTTRIERRCPCCTRGVASERSWRVLVVGHGRTWFGKWTLANAIAAVVGRHKTPIDTPWACEQCGHRGVANEDSQFQKLPPVLIVSLPRVSREGQVVKVDNAEMWYGLTLDLSPLTRDRADVFALKAVMVVAGSPANARLRSFGYIESLKAWVCFADTHLIETSPESVIIPSAATLLVYERGE